LNGAEKETLDDNLTDSTTTNDDSLTETFNEESKHSKEQINVQNGKEQEENKKDDEQSNQQQQQEPKPSLSRSMGNFESKEKKKEDNQSLKSKADQQGKKRVLQKGGPLNGSMPILSPPPPRRLSLSVRTNSDSSLRREMKQVC
jgi:hypothetical protein